MHADDHTLLYTNEFSLCQDESHLRILQTTDIHANLLPYNYFADRADPNVGLLRMTDTIREARGQAANSILLDCGDILQGTPLGDYCALKHPEGHPDHPLVRAMNELEYDAATVGNHEFNYGLDYLTQVMSGTGFPVVLANAATRLGDTPDQDETLFPPYAILKRRLRGQDGQMRSLRVGIIGFVPPQVAIWDHQHLANRLHLRCVTEAARAHVPRMKAEGADIVIALNHSGIGAPEDIAFQENSSIPLAAVEGIDVVLCGHQHRRFPGTDFHGIEGVDPQAGTLHGKPAVMAGFWGSDLGVIDLALSQDVNGEWSVRRHRSFLRPIPAHDQLTTAQPEPTEHRQTLNHIRTTVAQTEQPLHTYFCFTGFDPATRLVALAQRDRARQLLGASDLPVLSAASPFRAGGHAGPGNYTVVPTGPLSLRNIADLYLFPNTLSILRVSGAQVREWLERSAGIFRQLVPGQPDQPLLDGRFPSYNFDFILGLTYRIDLSAPSRYALDGSLAQPGATRILDLCHDGVPLRDDQEFLLATNSYRAGGGGAFAGTGAGNLALSTPDEIRTTLADWVRARPKLDLPPALNWQFADLAGASAIFRSAPEAKEFPPPPHLRLDHVGRDDKAFDLFRLHL